MLDAFAAAYPARWSWPAKLLLPTVHPMTFVRAVHLGLMFPLGIASFVFLVVTLAVGGSLIWTLIGPVVLLLGLYISRWFGDLEAWRVRHVAGIELRRPPTGIERGQSFRQQVKTRLIDPSTWTGLVYLFVQFPIGIAAFCLLVVGGAVAGAFIGAPFYATYIDGTEVNEAVTVSIDLGFWSTILNEPGEIGVALVPVGLLVYFVLVHTINIATAIHASWARLMLGSRAEPIPLGPADTPPPTQPTDDPPPGGALDGPEAPPADGDPGDPGDPVAPALEETVAPALEETVALPPAPAPLPAEPAPEVETPPAAEPLPRPPEAQPDVAPLDAPPPAEIEAPEVRPPDVAPPDAEPPRAATSSEVTPGADPEPPAAATPADHEHVRPKEPPDPTAGATPPAPASDVVRPAASIAASPAPPLRLTPSEPPPAPPATAEPLANQLVPELDAPLLVATVEPLDALTTREREVLTLIARGYSNAAIAETFVISEGTVKTHVKRVLSKLGLRDRTQAAIYAYETSFVVARAAVDTAAAIEPIPLTRTRAR